LGDVHRGVRSGLDAGSVGRGLRAVIWERSAGQVVQVAVALVVLLVLPSPVHGQMPLVVAVAVVVLLAALAAAHALARGSPAPVARALRTAGGEVRDALLHPRARVPVALTSLLVVAGHVVMFLVAARAVGVDASVGRLLPLTLLVLMGASIPVNVAGWGPREGAAAAVFAVAGLGAGQGVAVATAFGVLTVVATLPGAVVLLAGRRREPPAPAAPAEPELARGPGRG
jgi:hypothetical protein